MLQPAPYRIYPCGDHAVTIELGDAIDLTVNEKVMALFGYVKAAQITGVQDVIPSYHTITLVYDITVLKKQSPASSVYEMMCGELQKAVNAYTATSYTVPRLVKIPVCYDLSLAPDLGSLAASHHLSVAEVIQLHTAKTYRVYMIGFLPGFAYMGSVDDKIITPRKEKPRTKVPAGSVGIAGRQTGIYPLDSPGGWQLIGQTPVQMFTIAKEEPCYLQPGDEVQFYPVSINEFKKLVTT